MSAPSFIVPDWSAPSRVRALTTTRADGVSRVPYDSLNLGDHVGDELTSVLSNRATLRTALTLPSEPIWLKQVHGVRVVEAGADDASLPADGAYTRRRDVVLAILTADCLPVFLCDREGTAVAVLHAGWRGLAAGVIDAGVRALNIPADRILAHLGPAIGPASYEVGEDVRQVFVKQEAELAQAFQASRPGHWFADLYALARRRLRALGVRQVSGGDRCTVRERELFYSFRRDGITGRMASLIWLT